MGLFGRSYKQEEYHPRKKVEFAEPLNTESINLAFENCADYSVRQVDLGGGKEVSFCSVIGMVRTERANDYILRPMAQDPRLGCATMEEVFTLLQGGGLYTMTVKAVDTVDQGVAALIAGEVLLLFPGLPQGLACGTATEEKRAVSDPKDEPALKGARDCFVESLRTNTSLVRRRLRSPYLKVREQIVGRQTRTPVDVVYLEDIADPNTVAQVEAQLAKIDIDALLAAGNLEQYLVDQAHTPFPLVVNTQRPDRFCQGLVAGRVGIIADGIPLGFLVPGTVGQFFRTWQDRTDNWMVASMLALLRYSSMLVTLFLPAIYVAAVNFHPEMIPARLALSIIQAKAGVPFGTVFEVLIMLLAFEVIQEAGLRLPGNMGQTVSILGGLVVGSAAVEAKIVSPAVLIVVALAGIAGYTQPSQDFAGALRIWRFVLAVAASWGGLLGVVLGGSLLVGHLAGIETFGVPYLTPFASASGEQVEGGAVLPGPLPRRKYRSPSLNTKNRRNQR